MDELAYKIAMGNRQMIYNLVISLAQKGVISYDEAREIESPAEGEKDIEIKIEKKSEAELIEEITLLNAEIVKLKARLEKIEDLARSGFREELSKKPKEQLLMARAQKLAEIYQIFIYDLSTVWVF